jgi:hypothetical protein
MPHRTMLPNHGIDALSHSLESFGPHNCLNKLCHHVNVFCDVFFASQ